jgi:phage gp36-like protein
MYATQQDIVDRYSADALLMVTDRDGNVDVQQVLRALEDADDEINTYIGKRYPLPLVTVPRVITRVAVDLALYRLSDGAGYTEERRQRYDDAVKLLASIAAGKVSLGLDADTSEDASPAGQHVEVDSQPRRFNRPSMNRVL